MGREEGSGWGTHVYLWQIHFDIWQNQYNIVKLNKIKLKKNKTVIITLYPQRILWNNFLPGSLPQPTLMELTFQS